jgi:hypothetical protein
MFAGCISILVGLLIVTSHNIWTPEWPLLITLIGWVALLKGIAEVYVPDQFVKSCRQLHDKAGFYLVTWIWLLIGLYLIWTAFSVSNAEMMQ